MLSLFEFIVRGALLGSIYTLLSLPLSLLFVTTGLVDMAVGVYAVLTAATVLLVGGLGGYVAGIALAVAASAIVGAASLRTNRPGTGQHMSAVLVTFGSAIFLESLILTVFGKNAIARSSTQPFFEFLGMFLSQAALINLAISLLTLAALMLVLFRTPYGRAMRASASNPRGAELAGISVYRVWFSTFLIGGLLSSIAGLLFLNTTGLMYDSGLQLSISAFGAAILFGLQGPMRAFLGGISIGVVEALCTGYLPGAWAVSVPYAFIFFVLATGRLNTSAAIGGRA